MKRAFVKSYGCQMNVYDAERMADVLGAEGYAAAATAEEADVVVLNTCHIREKAAEKVYSELGRLREWKRERVGQGREARIVVAGCVAQAEGAEIMRRAPAVDVVVGPQSYHHLPSLLAEAGRGVSTEFPVESKFDHLPPLRREAIRASGVSAFLSVQEGCDKFCTFCVVPYTRGAELSRPVERVLEEARRLLEAGVREITVIGQNVNAYHGDGPGGRTWSLADLLHRLAELGVARLRYTTSHPRDMGDDLVDAHGALGQLMPYLHLPVQSGSDRVLAAMNRGHTGDAYRRLAERVREARPDLALSSDFIVGFPGETEAEFEETLGLIRDVGFAASFSFKYSPRPGTPAAALPGQVPETAKAERLARLQALLEEQRQAFNASMVGRTLPVLVEKPGRHPGQVAGKSPYLQPVHLRAELAPGSVVPVRITERHPNSLSGEPVGSGHAEAA